MLIHNRVRMRRTHSVLLTLGWFVVIATVIISKAPIAAASHPDNGSPQRHLNKIHANTTGSTSGANDEDYCADSLTSSMSDATAKDIVKRTLVDLSPHWDGTGNYRIDLWVTANPCLSYSDRLWIEIEYRVYANASSYCGSDNVSCTYHYGPVNSGTHSDYSSEIVFLDYQNVDGGEGEYRTTINHESGHVFGLLDPVEGNPQPYCQNSIMHIPYYNCSYNLPYPSNEDFSSVVNIMNR